MTTFSARFAPVPAASQSASNALCKGMAWLRRLLRRVDGVWGCPKSATALLPMAGLHSFASMEAHEAQSAETL